MIREKFSVNFIHDAKVISGNHENGGLDNFGQVTASFFQNGLDIQEALPCLILEIIAGDFSGNGVQARHT